MNKLCLTFTLFLILTACTKNPDYGQPSHNAPVQMDNVEPAENITFNSTQPNKRFEYLVIETPSQFSSRMVDKEFNIVCYNSRSNGDISCVKLDKPNEMQ